jgi:hypothetical protein
MTADSSPLAKQIGGILMNILHLLFDTTGGFIGLCVAAVIGGMYLAAWKKK